MSPNSLFLNSKLFQQNMDGVIDRNEFEKMANSASMSADGELITVVAQRMGTFEASLVR